MARLPGCSILYTLRSGPIEATLATGLIWTTGRPVLVFRQKLVCVPNVRALRDGTLVPL